MNKVCGFDGEEILQEMLQELEFYKNKSNSKSYIISKKQNLIDRLNKVMSRNIQLKLYEAYKIIDNDIAKALANDPEIGGVHIFIPLSRTKKETFCINFSKSISQ